MTWLDVLRRWLAGLIAPAAGLASSARPAAGETAGADSGAVRELAIPIVATPAAQDLPRPLSQGYDGFGSFGDWNPWSRYVNPISVFYTFYQANPWVRAVCDKIAAEVLADDYVLEDLTRAAQTPPEMTWVGDWLGVIDFASKRHQGVLDLAICNNAMLFKQRNLLGQRVDLIRIPPQTMKPVGNAEVGIIAWRQTVGFRSKIFAAEDILHIHGANPVTDLVGLPVLTAATIDLEADEAMSLFNRAFFGNGSSAGTVFTWDQSDLRGPKGEWTEDDERKAIGIWTNMVAHVERRYQNPTSAHLPLIMRGKWDVKGGGQAKADAQFLEGRKFNAREVCALYGFPVEALGMSEKGALGGSLSDQAAEQLDSCVAAYEKLFDRQFRSKFLIPDLGLTTIATAPKPRPTKLTLAATQAALNLAKTGAHTKNEVRAVSRHPRLSEGGDEVYQIIPTGETKDDKAVPSETPLA